MVFKPNFGLDPVRWVQSVCAAGLITLDMFEKEQIKSVVDRGPLKSTRRPDPLRRKRRAGVHIFKPLAENALMVIGESLMASCY